MGNVQLVIKIPEEKLNIIKDKMYCGIYDPDLYKAIANGTPLPKGHGRLIDADDLFDNTCIDEIPTIIEADTEESRYGLINDGLDVALKIIESAKTVIEADKE